MRSSRGPFNPFDCRSNALTRPAGLQLTPYASQQFLVAFPVHPVLFPHADPPNVVYSSARMAQSEVGVEATAAAAAPPTAAAVRPVFLDEVAEDEGEEVEVVPL